MAKAIRCIISALVGIALAAVLYTNFEIFRIKTDFMYPALHRGQRVLINKTNREQVADLRVGDLVLFEAPFYDFDTQDGLLAVRRVSGRKDNMLLLECDAPAASKDVVSVTTERIRGKVILWQKKKES